ncbi:MAG: type I-E CRISPR-associated protein Cas7/Cse4/CasC [Desulfovibrionaceae bacterium]
MSKYIQLHILTSYPASNLNRDDLGRPKTVTMGNTTRLRVSSQSLKRAWRTSDVFHAAVGDGHIGTRTKEMGEAVYWALLLGRPLDEVLNGEREPGSLPTLKEKSAHAIATAVAGVFGKLKTGKDKDDEEGEDKPAELVKLHIEQLAHFAPAEIAGIATLTEACRASGKVPTGDELNLLRSRIQAADIALFGRMLAASKRFNKEAAAQVAHAVTVHKVVVEDDFFTAVDDLNRDSTGAGHMGVFEFGAGLYYLYVCVDRDLLAVNLDGDEALAAKALQGLCRAACTVAPTGKQNSFASRAYASFCLAEKGDAQPRSLAVAFLQGLDRPGDLLAQARDALLVARDNMDKVYGDTPGSRTFDAAEGAGSLDDVCAFIAE